MADQDPTDDAPPTSDETLAALLASGLSVPKAAKKVRLSERTLRRRLADAEFRRLLDGLKAEAVSAAAGVLGREMAASAEELVKLRRRSKDERVRLAAAKELLGAGAKVRQLEEIERQVTGLAERVDKLTAEKGAR